MFSNAFKNFAATASDNIRQSLESLSSATKQLAHSSENVTKEFRLAVKDVINGADSIVRTFAESANEVGEKLLEALMENSRKLLFSVESILTTMVKGIEESIIRILTEMRITITQIIQLAETMVKEMGVTVRFSVGRLADSFQTSVVSLSENLSSSMADGMKNMLSGSVLEIINALKGAFEGWGRRSSVLLVGATVLTMLALSARLLGAGGLGFVALGVVALAFVSIVVFLSNGSIRHQHKEEVQKTFIVQDGPLDIIQLVGQARSPKKHTFLFGKDLHRIGRLFALVPDLTMEHVKSQFRQEGHVKSHFVQSVAPLLLHVLRSKGSIREVLACSSIDGITDRDMLAGLVELCNDEDDVKTLVQHWLPSMKDPFPVAWSRNIQDSFCLVSALKHVNLSSHQCVVSLGCVDQKTQKTFMNQVFSCSFGEKDGVTDAWSIQAQLHSKEQSRGFHTLQLETQGQLRHPLLDQVITLAPQCILVIHLFGKLTEDLSCQLQELFDLHRKVQRIVVVDHSKSPSFSASICHPHKVFHASDLKSMSSHLKLRDEVSAVNWFRQINHSILSELASAMELKDELWQELLQKRNSKKLADLLNIASPKVFDQREKRKPHKLVKTVAKILTKNNKTLLSQWENVLKCVGQEKWTIWAFVHEIYLLSKSDMKYRAAHDAWSRKCIAEGSGVELINGTTLSMMDCHQDNHQGASYCGVAVVGRQSGGKSTLLDLLFGLSFDVDALKCSKGVAVAQIDCNDDLVLGVADTEGLMGPERDDPIFDNTMALFVFSTCPVILFNIHGQITASDLNILNMVQYAIKSLGAPDLKHDIFFTVRGVEPSKCDSMTHQIMEALSKRNISIFNRKRIFCLPEAFSIESVKSILGEEPMKLTKWNADYFEELQFLRKELHLACKDHAKQASFSVWTKHARSQWDWLRRNQSLFVMENEMLMQKHLTLTRVRLSVRSNLFNLLDPLLHHVRCAALALERDSSQVTPLDQKLIENLPLDYQKGIRLFWNPDCSKVKKPREVFLDNLLRCLIVATSDTDALLSAKNVTQVDLKGLACRLGQDQVISMLREDKSVSVVFGSNRGPSSSYAFVQIDERDVQCIMANLARDLNEYISIQHHAVDLEVICLEKMRELCVELNDAIDLLRANRKNKDPDAERNFDSTLEMLKQASYEHFKNDFENVKVLLQASFSHETMPRFSDESKRIIIEDPVNFCNMLRACVEKEHKLASRLQELLGAEAELSACDVRFLHHFLDALDGISMDLSKAKECEALLNKVPSQAHELFRSIIVDRKENETPVSQHVINYAYALLLGLVFKRCDDMMSEAQDVVMRMTEAEINKAKNFSRIIVLKGPRRAEKIVADLMKIFMKHMVIPSKQWIYINLQSTLRSPKEHFCDVLIEAFLKKAFMQGGDIAMVKRFATQKTRESVLKDYFRQEIWTSFLEELLTKAHEIASNDLKKAKSEMIDRLNCNKQGFDLLEHVFQAKGKTPWSDEVATTIDRYKRADLASSQSQDTLMLQEILQDSIVSELQKVLGEMHVDVTLEPDEENRLFENYYRQCRGGCTAVCIYCGSPCITRHEGVGCQKMHTAPCHFPLAFNGWVEEYGQIAETRSCSTRSRDRLEFVVDGETMTFDDHRKVFADNWDIPFENQDDPLAKAIRKTMFMLKDWFQKRFGYQADFPESWEKGQDNE